jgi:serine/threonine protein kinase
LETVHKAGYLYNDLKCENVVVNRTRNQIKAHLVDFGFSEPYLKSHVKRNGLSETFHIERNEKEEF